MATFLLPYADIEGAYIDSCSAKTMQQAEDKFINSLIEEYEVLEGSDILTFNNFREKALKYKIQIGSIYYHDEF